MSRRPPPNSLNRSVLTELNERENLRKIIKSKEFNLERQKELKKIIEGQTQLLINQQKIKAKKLKANRGKNLRSGVTKNKTQQRRFERGERRYSDIQEPRILGDPIVNVNVPQQQGFTGFTNQSPEDRQLLRDRMALEFNERTQTRLQAGVEAGQRLQLEDRRLQLEDRREDRRINIDEGNRNRMANLEQLRIETDRNIRADSNEIQRLDLQARRDNIDLQPIPEIPTERVFNIGNHQFFGNVLTGIAQDKQREREHTETIMRELLQHNNRTAGAMDNDILDRLFQEGRHTGLRVPGSVVESLGPSPPPPSVILAPDRPQQPQTPAQEIEATVRRTLSQPAEGSQISIGALTELERELEIPVVPRDTIDDFLSELGTQSDYNLGFSDSVSDTIGTQSDHNLGFSDSVSDTSSIHSSEFHRQVDEADDVFGRTAEGIENRLAQDKFNEENPFILVGNPLDDLDLTESQTGKLEDLEKELSTSEELEQLREQGIAAPRQRLEDIEEGAGTGLLQQGANIIGGGLVAGGGALLQGAGGVLQGAGEAILEQLPSPGQVGNLAGRGIVAGGGALLSGAGNLVKAAASAVVGGGAVEDVDEELLVDVNPTDEGELLEEVGNTTLNPAEQRDNQIDYGEFVTHHAQQSARKGRKGLRDADITQQYQLQNTSDKVHKKINPGEVVDITSYRSDFNLGDSIGFKSNIKQVGASGRETTIKLPTLDKSIDKGFLKIIKK